MSQEYEEREMAVEEKLVAFRRIVAGDVELAHKFRHVMGAMGARKISGGKKVTVPSEVREEIARDLASIQQEQPEG